MHASVRFSSGTMILLAVMMEIWDVSVIYVLLARLAMLKFQS
jgi:hypothetical protein